MNEPENVSRLSREPDSGHHLRPNYGRRTLTSKFVSGRSCDGFLVKLNRGQVFRVAGTIGSQVLQTVKTRYLLTFAFCRPPFCLYYFHATDFNCDTWRVGFTGLKKKIAKNSLT